MFLKRIGPAPNANGANCVGCQACPDIWELDNGDFAIIGLDMTAWKDQLPPTAGCAPDERMVRIPRHVLIAAKRDIPDHV